MRDRVVTGAMVLFLGLVFYGLSSRTGETPSDGNSYENLPPPELLPFEPPSTGEGGEGNAGNRALLPYRGVPVATLNADPDTILQIPTNVYQNSVNELAGLAVDLAAHPANTEGWMRVAYIKHFYGDDAGARDVYEYLNVIAEGDPLAFYNLAVIYGYYLKDPARAAVKYEAAIQRGPLQASFYVGFADFYREVMRNPVKAEEILHAGLAKIPKNPYLLQALGSLFAANGNTAEAVRIYEEALTVIGVEDEGVRASIQNEIERLKNLP